MNLDFKLDGTNVVIACGNEEDAQLMMKVLYGMVTAGGAEILGLIGINHAGEEVRTGIFNTDTPVN